MFGTNTARWGQVRRDRSAGTSGERGQSGGPVICEGGMVVNFKVQFNLVFVGVPLLLAAP